jgi:hypothetical protein
MSRRKAVFPARVTAKAKVVSDHRMPYTEPIDEIALHEILCQFSAKDWLKRRAKYLVTPGASEPSIFSRQRSSLGGAFSGLKNSEGCGFEGHYGCGHSQLPGPGLQCSYQL